MLDLRPFVAADLIEIEVQPSQAELYGEPLVRDAQTGAALEAQELSRTARDGQGRILACFGINQVFAGRHGVAWALLAEGIGSDHAALTRAMRELIDGSGLVRVEMTVKAADRLRPDMLPNERMRFVLGKKQRTAEVRLALALGMEPVHVLRGYGAKSETYLLCEKLALWRRAV